MASPSMSSRQESATHAASYRTTGADDEDFFEADEEAERDDTGSELSEPGMDEDALEMSEADDGEENNGETVPESGPLDHEEEQRRRELELQRFQEDLRRQILEIQQDESIPELEKSKKIQVSLPPRK